MARREFQNPNLQERETPNGLQYYIRYRVPVIEMRDGKPVKIRREKWDAIGMASEMSKKQAERKRAEILRMINRQVFAIQSQIPFGEFLKIFDRQHVPELAVPTQNTYRQWISRYIEPRFGDCRMCDIKPIDIQLFLSELTTPAAAGKQGVPLAATTRNSIRGILASIYSCAREWGYWTEESPVRTFVKRRKAIAGVRERRIPTPEQVRQILEAVDGDRRLIIETLIWTGIRISECLGLRPKHFDLARGILRITERQCRGDVDAPKSHAGVRTIPLGQLAEQYTPRLAALAPDAFVFTRKDGKPYKDCELLANYLTPRLVKLGLKFPGFGWHTFRRLLASWMDQNGASVFEIMEQLGHSSPESTKLYVVGGVGRRADIIASLQAKFKNQELCGIDGAKVLTKVAQG